MSTNRVGLVLGAGGFGGRAFHAGVLSALHEGLGWEPRSAEGSVWTSAGYQGRTTRQIGMWPPDLAASCAVPWLFAPVEVDGVRYFDGGVHSPTNLDLLAGLGLDLVIVVSPMSVARHPGRQVDLPLRRLFRLRLGREAAKVRRG